MSTVKLGILVAVTCGALGAGASACGGGDSSDSTAAAPASTTPAKSAGAAGNRGQGASVKVMNTRYGRMLFDGRGRALYLFTRESGSSASRCYGECAAAWPPFFTRGKPHAGSGARASLLGTTRRRDGRTQVTYRGQPLYYYVTDRKPGQVTCQNVAEFGGTWLVVSPGGQAIR
jgi:predicted lipoprotein with Yx(FWY)xxD motif